MNPGGATTESVQLSPQDTDLIALIALGFANHDIACQLNISGGELKQRISRLLAKLNLKQRVELILYAHTDPLVTNKMSVLTAQANSRT